MLLNVRMMSFRCCISISSMHVADIFGMDKMISAAMFNDTLKMVVAWVEIG